MSKTPFKILKLKSGDDIVARLVKNTKEFIRLERPMVFKKCTTLTTMSGKKRNNRLI